MENVSRGLVVNPVVIRKNLEEHLQFMATETILMLAVQKGGDRQTLHEAIRSHSMEAARRMKEEGERADLLERIEGDPAFQMPLEELQTLVDPRRFVGRAPEQVDRFLLEWVDPVLKRYSEESNQALGDPDVRV
jgi:adenylosuccinate lyase